MYRYICACVLSFSQCWFQVSRTTDNKAEVEAETKAVAAFMRCTLLELMANMNKYMYLPMNRITVHGKCK